MDYFRPHTNPQPTFEGYYSKFSLPSGAELALIICSVPQSTNRPHMVSFTYVPPAFPELPYFQREIWADDIVMLDHRGEVVDETARQVRFELRIPDVGFMKVYTDGATEYKINDPQSEFTFTANVPGGTENRTAWKRGVDNSTPEGLLIYLPLPLHWHVHNLASTCTFNMTIRPNLYQHLHALDDNNNNTNPERTALVHQEKNWAHSFPTSHIWIKAHNAQTQTSLNVAGGAIIGTEAYLLTYQAADPTHDVTFTPPYAMAPAVAPTFSPTMTATHSWPARTLTLTVSGWTQKIEIEARAPAATFVGLSAPFHDGHRPNFLGQSYRASVRVRVYRASRWGWGHWVLCADEVFERAALEFGGDFYGMAGQEARVN